MKLPNLTNLEQLCSESDGIDQRISDSKSKLAALPAEEKKLLETATGPEDEGALNALSLIASRERLLNRDIQLAGQERVGLAGRLLNEATAIGNAVKNALLETSKNVLADADLRLQDLYPVERDRRKILNAMQSGSYSVASLPVLRPIQSLLSSFPRFVPGQQDEVEFAKLVLRNSHRALAAIQAAEATA